MNQREMIQALGGPAQLSRLTGLSIRTIGAYNTGARTLKGPALLAFKLMIALSSEGRLEEVLDNITPNAPAHSGGES